MNRYSPTIRAGNLVGYSHGGRLWYSGPPPHPGWWNASTLYVHAIWRWWNGLRWSLAVTADSSAAFAAACAEQSEPPHRQHTIQWTDYWPEGARVQRRPGTEGTPS